MDEIAQIRASGSALDAKKDLAKTMVKDFHSAEEAERVASAWGGLPPVETLDHTVGTDSRLNRLLVQARFVNSVTEADKIVKSNGVSVNRVESGGEITIGGPAHKLDSGDYIIRVGKKYKHVTVS
jgi:tyrosyl-tRNA synthetase